ncbi:MAG: M56 family metallopeptidase [Acidobacteria bacterium]|nr:M56 family metallopeptidase [Acidobacteriota bacterium]
MTAIMNMLAHYAPSLIDIFVKSAVLLLGVVVTGHLLRRRAASLRHFLYSTAAVSLLILPLGAALLPRMGIAVLPRRSVVQASSVQASNPLSQRSDSAVPAFNPSSVRSQSRREKPAQALQPSPVLAAPISQSEETFNAKPGAFTDAAQWFAKINWQGALVLLWVCGVAVCLVRMFVIGWRLRGIVRRAVPVESIVLASRLRWLCRDFGIRREVTLLSSAELDVPIAAGIFDSKIILSPQCDEWTETRRNAVLCHEIAHIKRLDALTQFLASIAAAIYWMNPLVWFVLRAMRMEREKACDDHVLASGTAASDYAHELIDIVSTLVRPQPAAALAMARRSQLEGRVLALVNPRIAHGLLKRRAALVLSGSILALALPLAAVRLEERPAVAISAAVPTASHAIVAAVAQSPVSTSEARTAEAPAPPANPPSTGDETAANIGIPVYPGAIARDHEDGRGTVNVADGAHVRSLTATTYFSSDEPAKVLAFYRTQLKPLGNAIECTGGKDTREDVRVTDASFADPSACRGEEFAQGGTELKINSGADRRVVVILPYQRGSEIALVRYSPAPEGSGARHELVWNSATSDCVGGSSGHNVHNSVQSHTDDNGYNTWTATWSGDECSLEASSAGTVRFNAEATEIESISPGGHFEINERKGDTLRRLRIESNQNGQLAFTYKLNGAQQEFDSAGRAWFSALLVQLERATGFAASTRVPALLAKGGPQAVLDEITKLQSDYVRQVYFTKLFENATLPAPLLVRALDQAREEISTDYSLAQVLLTIAQRYDLNDEKQRVAFLNGANKLTTDYEHSRVLLELLKRPNLSPEILHAALESAKGINTDYEKSRILTTIVSLKEFNAGEMASYLDLAGAIHTDYEHSRCLLAFIQHQKVSPAAMNQILRSASSIGTDYEKSRVLLAVDQSGNFDEQQISTYLGLVDSIGTDYERSRDLIGLMHDHKLGEDALAKIIAETQKIGTDYEKARVLTEVAQRYKIQGSTREAYIRAANSIGTDYERNRTLAAITSREVM